MPDWVCATPHTSQSCSPPLSALASVPRAVEAAAYIILMVIKLWPHPPWPPLLASPWGWDSQESCARLYPPNPNDDSRSCQEGRWHNSEVWGSSCRKGKPFTSERQETKWRAGRYPAHSSSISQAVLNFQPNPHWRVNTEVYVTYQLCLRIYCPGNPG